MDTILLTTSSFAVDSPVMLQKLENRGFIVVANPFKRTLTEDEAEQMMEEYNPVGIIAGVEPITARVLKKAVKLKVISRCGIGMENVDLGEAKQKKIQVFNTPDAPSQAVAELTIALILNLIRRVNEADRNIRGGQWSKLMGRLLSELTVGIIGCGRIGSQVALYLKAFGSKVIGFDTLIDEHKDIKIVPLPELLKESDVITFHVPSTPQTNGMVNDAFINMVKNGSFIVNTSRGELIDENALIRGLESGKVAAAAIDTFKEEPYKGPLINFKNVLLTAHMGSYAKEARIKMEQEALENLLKGMEVSI